MQITKTPKTVKQKPRVCAYARVSTDKLDQANREEQSLHPSPSHISEKIENMSQQINDQQINEEFFEKIIQEKLLEA